MNFCIPREHVVTHQDERLLHRIFRRFLAPHIRSQMISAKDNPFEGKVYRCRYFADEVREIGRFLTRISAKLVYLIRCGFNQQQAVISFRLLHSRLQHVTIGRAERINTHGSSFAIASKKGSQSLGRCCSARLRVAVHPDFLRSQTFWKPSAPGRRVTVAPFSNAGHFTGCRIVWVNSPSCPPLSTTFPRFASCTTCLKPPKRCGSAAWT